MNERDLSRRQLLTFWRRKEEAPPAPEPPPPDPPRPLRAQVDWERCLAYRNTGCDVCIKTCPVPLAIRPDGHGHPRVYLSHCTGCGECERVCPTDPPAIALQPVG